MPSSLMPAHMASNWEFPFYGAKPVLTLSKVVKYMCNPNAKTYNPLASENIESLLGSPSW